jgi:hypothetical protein
MGTSSPTSSTPGEKFGHHQKKYLDCRIDYAKLHSAFGESFAAQDGRDSGVVKYVSRSHVTKTTGSPNTVTSPFCIVSAAVVFFTPSERGSYAVVERTRR